MKKFWPNTLKRMKERNVTWDSMSQMLGVSRNTFRSWYKRDLAPSLDYAVRMADILGVSVNELAGTKEGVVLSPKERNLLLMYNKLGEGTRKVVLNLLKGLSSL